MADGKSKSAVRRASADTSAAVDQFMADLKHPYKGEIEALRKIIVASDSSISEGIKWNSPSFRTDEYFATTHLRAKTGIGLVLHLGAKIRALPKGGVVIDDPSQLLKWLGKDRAMIEFTDLATIKKSKTALQSLLRQWIRYV